MNKARNPEFDKRDLLFAHSCEKCDRAFNCAFKTSPEGPEEVCRQLIVGGTYHCESCVRHKIGGGCHFECTFFRPKLVEQAPERGVLHLPKLSLSEEIRQTNLLAARNGRSQVREYVNDWN